MVLQGQSKHTGQTQAPLSSGTSSSNPKSESNDFVALPFSSSWPYRINRSTQVRPKLLCFQAPPSLVQNQRAINLNVWGGEVFSLPIIIEQSIAKQCLSGFELLSNERQIVLNAWGVQKTESYTHFRMLSDNWTYSWEISVVVPPFDYFRAFGIPVSKKFLFSPIFKEMK